MSLQCSATPFVKWEKDVAKRSATSLTDHDMYYLILWGYHLGIEKDLSSTEDPSAQTMFNLAAAPTF